MQLIKRYLHAVKTWLPEKHQADYLPELEDDLKSQIEERESALGRKLDENEAAEILRQRGHPMLVATRLMPQQHLIGPAWYPVWRFALRAIIIWILAPVFILIVAPFAALSSANPFNAFMDVVLGLPVAALNAAATITLVIALLERLQIKANPFGTWDPRNLPQAPANENPEWISRFESIVEMAAGMMFLLWWMGVIGGPAITEVDVRMGPAWTALYWPIVLVLASSVGFSTIKLLAPYWRPAYSAANLVIQAAIVSLLVLLINADPSVIVSSPTATAAQIEKLSLFLHWIIQISLLVVAVGCAMHLFADARRLFFSRKRNLTELAV